MSENKLPDNFSSVILDFVNDLTHTFPEYSSLWSMYNSNTTEKEWYELYEYCLTVYPERFFDILYQNIDIFHSNESTNTMFLPNVEFKFLFHCDGVTEKTRESIWKYIQLILFTIVGNVKDKSEFGKTMNLFDGIDEKELQEKLTEAMENMTDFFKNVESKDSNNEEEKKSEFFEKMFSHSDSIPSPEDLHSHLKDLFGGKLGGLAKELMEELTDEIKEALGLDPNDFNENANPKDLFAKLMKHPDKFMKIVSKINAKFQEKMKSGDLSKEDIMKEATEMLKKMKEMGGNSKQMQEMFQNMAKTMGGGAGQFGKNCKVDTNAIDRMMKMQSTKDRLRAKLEKKKETFLLEASTTNQNTLVYKPLECEPAIRSLLKPEMTNEDLEKLAAEIDKPSVSESEKKKKKKNKK
jgi:hypothetical protein